MLQFAGPTRSGGLPETARYDVRVRRADPSRHLPDPHTAILADDQVIDEEAYPGFRFRHGHE
jgi:hypothetical protein